MYMALWVIVAGAQLAVDFDLDQDEEMLKALVERFVDDRYDPERRRAYLGEDQGFSVSNWTLLGELGLIGTGFGEESGGFGAKPSTVAILFRALGRGLVVEPLLESVFVAGRLFEATASEDLCADWLDGLVSGERRLAFAHKEHAARKNLRWVETTARRDGGGWVLNGEKSLVPAAVGCDGFIVSTRIVTGNGGHGDHALFFVNAGCNGMELQRYRTVDGSVAASIRLENLFVEEAHRLQGGIDEIEAVEELAAIARSAEALGIMERIFEETLDYLRTRKQFGRPIGSFQALQHRMVSQYANLEQAKSLLYYAVMDDHGDERARRQAVYGARSFIADASVAMGHEAMQLHGGMGVTDELAIGQAHKRLVMLSRFPNDSEDALNRYVGLS